MYASTIFVLNIISSNSDVLNKLFIGFGFVNIIFVLIALYIKYVVDLYKKLKDNNYKN